MGELTIDQLLHRLGVDPDERSPADALAEARAKVFDAVCERMKATPAELIAAPVSTVIAAIQALGKPPPSPTDLPALLADYAKLRAVCPSPSV